jgi:hypothetical protein
MDEQDHRIFFRLVELRRFDDEAMNLGFERAVVFKIFGFAQVELRQ